MKYFISTLFIVSLVGVCFLSLNYLWGWLPIDYGTVGKIVLSALILLLAITGLAMIRSGAFARNPAHPSVGKK